MGTCRGNGYRRSCRNDGWPAPSPDHRGRAGPCGRYNQQPGSREAIGRLGIGGSLTLTMVLDLSTRHEPVSGLLAGALRDWRQYRLSDQQVAFFHDTGTWPAFACSTTTRSNGPARIGSVSGSLDPGNRLFLRIPFERVRGSGARVVSARLALGASRRAFTIFCGIPLFGSSESAFRSRREILARPTFPASQRNMAA